MIERFQTVYRRIERFIADGEMAGAALAVAHKGQTVAEWYGGEARPGLPAGPNVLWPLASISKCYTAAMLMALIEQGEITLNTLVKSLLPKFSGGAKEEIRLRHLLTHTSGLIYESPEMAARMAALTPREAIIDEAYPTALLFQPSEGFSYGDYNYLLAGEMAAMTMGKPFAELVREYVIEPMGLKNTYFAPPVSEHKRIAYVKGSQAEGTDGAMYNSAYSHALAHPAFGASASVTDLLRFELHFAPHGPRLHSEATVRAMSSDQTGGRAVGWHPAIRSLSSNPPVQSWGIGFYFVSPPTIGVFGDLMPMGTFGHGGASGCQLVINPFDEICVAYVSNTHVAAGWEAWRRRAQVVMNGVMAALT